MYYIKTETEKIPVISYEFVIVQNGLYHPVKEEDADGVLAEISTCINDDTIFVAFAFEGHTLFGEEEVAALIWEDDPEPEPENPDEDIDSDTFKAMIEEIL